MSKTAIFVRDLVIPEDFTGVQKLYLLSKDVDYFEWSKDCSYSRILSTGYVVVSAVVLEFLREVQTETYIFPANKEGQILSFRELPGSYKGGLDHETALNNMGYTLE